MMAWIKDIDIDLIKSRAVITLGGSIILIWEDVRSCRPQQRGEGWGFSRVECKLFGLFELLINVTKTLHELPTFKKCSMKFNCTSNEVTIKFQ